MCFVSSLQRSEGGGLESLKAGDLSALVKPTCFEGISQGRGRGNIKEEMDSSNI